MVNIELIKENYKTAVHCAEEWQASSLIKELDSVLPGQVYRGAIDWWYLYKKNTCYWPKFYSNGGFGIEYCDKEWFENEGFRVIDYSDIVYNLEDYGEINNNDADIYSLLVMGV